MPPKPKNITAGQVTALVYNFRLSIRPIWSTTEMVDGNSVTSWHQEHVVFELDRDALRVLWVARRSLRAMLEWALRPVREKTIRWFLDVIDPVLDAAEKNPDRNGWISFNSVEREDLRHIITDLTEFEVLEQADRRGGARR